MDKLQIVHDLAVAKAVKDGSDAKEIVELYRKYNEEFLNILAPNRSQSGKAVPTQNPFWSPHY